MIQNNLDESVQRATEQLTQLLENSVASIVKGLQVRVTLKSNLILNIGTLIENICRFPDSQKYFWLAAAEMGWYLNWETPLSSCYEAISAGKQDLDRFMVMHLEHDWEQITNEITNYCPNRFHVLKEAFTLHQEGRYIASIPLLLSQIDGICAEKLGAFLFSDHKSRPGKIAALQSAKSTHLFLKLALTPLAIKSQYGESIGKSSKTHKEKSPNRNGILHGSRKHLDYGTKLNSLKCFSLLAFVVFVLIDLNYDK